VVIKKKSSLSEMASAVSAFLSCRCGHWLPLKFCRYYPVKYFILLQ